MVQDEMEIDNSAMAEKQDVEKTLLEQLKEREALLCKAFEESTKNILSLSGPDGI